MQHSVTAQFPQKNRNSRVDIDNRGRRSEGLHFVPTFAAREQSAYECSSPTSEQFTSGIRTCPTIETPGGRKPAAVR